MKYTKRLMKFSAKPLFSAWIALILMLQIAFGIFSPNLFATFQKAEAASVINAFTYKKYINFNTSATGINVATNQTNFPVAVHINTSSWPTQSERDSFFDSNTNGKRIQFFDSDESTNLPYEVEYFSNVQGSEEALYWVKVPQVDGNSATDKIVVAYGNDPNGSDQDNKNSVWDGNFKGVWHLAETSGTVLDSTVNANSGTVSSGVSYNISGMVGKGMEFSGASGNNISVSTLGSLSNNYSVRFWLYHKGDFGTWVGTRRGPIYTGNCAGPAKLEFVTPNSSGQAKYNLGGYCGVINPTVFTTNTASLNQWLSLGLTVDSANLWRVYWDQNQDASTTTYAATLDGSTLKIGGDGRPFYGIMDEVRISNIARSADWLKLEYYSMKKTNYNGDNDGASKFITFSSQQSNVAPSVTFKGFMRFLGNVIFK